MNRHLLIVASLLAFSAIFAIAADRIIYERPRQLGRLANPDISESSGLAFGYENPDVLWTHNDAGDKSRIFAISIAKGIEGTHLAEYQIEGKNDDWEDMCSFKTERDSYLLIADVGDNDLKRKTYKLYMVKEPTLKKVKFGKIETLKPQTVIEFTYEDGSNNCEAIAVDISDPKKPVILLITKSETSCKVYELPLPERRLKEDPVAKLLTKITIPPVTAMDISPDGTRAVVLTYGDAYEFTRSGDQTWAQAFAGRPRVLEMPLRKQGETICFGSDGRTLYVTSEGKASPVWRIDGQVDEK